MNRGFPSSSLSPVIAFFRALQTVTGDTKQNDEQYQSQDESGDHHYGDYDTGSSCHNGDGELGK